jgi:hypothetical protein
MNRSYCCSRSVGLRVKTRRPEFPWIEPIFFENQRRFPPEELQRYLGQHIAWNWDGTSILASDPDRRVLDDKLRAAGIDTGRVVYDYVEDGDVSWLL